MVMPINTNSLSSDSPSESVKQTGLVVELEVETMGTLTDKMGEIVFQTPDESALAVHPQAATSDKTIDMADKSTPKSMAPFVVNTSTNHTKSALKSPSSFIDNQLQSSVKSVKFNKLTEQVLFSPQENKFNSAKCMVPTKLFDGEKPEVDAVDLTEDTSEPLISKTYCHTSTRSTDFTKEVNSPKDMIPLKTTVVDHRYLYLDSHNLTPSTSSEACAPSQPGHKTAVAIKKTNEEQPKPKRKKQYQKVQCDELEEISGLAVSPWIPSWFRRLSSDVLESDSEVLLAAIKDEQKGTRRNLTQAEEEEQMQDQSADPINSASKPENKNKRPRILLPRFDIPIGIEYQNIMSIYRQGQ